jgi:hypothetical protein
MIDLDKLRTAMKEIEQEFKDMPNKNWHDMYGPLRYGLIRIHVRAVDGDFDKEDDYWDVLRIKSEPISRRVVKAKATYRHVGKLKRPPLDLGDLRTPLEDYETHELSEELEKRLAAK